MDGEVDSYENLTPPDETFLDKLSSQLSKFKNKKSIIVLCHSGMRSKQAKTILEQNGFSNVLNGGTWQNVNQASK